MKFTKMQGIGNDYVYVNCFEEQADNPEQLAIRISDRHFGVGSDGLILIKPSELADFRMEMYNADGSLGAMCGNGIRCVAKYVYDHGMTDRTRIRVETGSGIKTLDLTVEEGKVTRVRVDMGAPALAPEQIPVIPEKMAGGSGNAGEMPEAAKTAASGGGDRGKTEAAQEAAKTAASGEGGWCGTAETAKTAASGGGDRGKTARNTAVVSRPLEAGGMLFRATCVSMGNPHCIVPVENVDGLEIGKIGPLFEYHPCFPDRVNTEFIRVLDRHTVQMRVWERGSGETLACGTGACAAAVACILNGWTEDAVTVKLLGGELEIFWDRKADTVYMTGPAETVFEGEIADCR